MERLIGLVSGPAHLEQSRFYLGSEAHRPYKGHLLGVWVVMKNVSLLRAWLGEDDLVVFNALPKMDRV